MGERTVDTIINEGLLAGGDDTIPTRALVALNSWLQTQAAAWPWPHVIRKVSGIALPAQTSVLTVGAGGGGISDIIKEVRRPIRLYSSDFKTRSQLDLIDGDETQANFDSTIAAGQAQYGLPVYAKVTAQYGTRGAWDLQPFPIPDKAYLLTFPIHVIPASYVLGQTPWYPEDSTMIKFVEAFARQWNKQPDWQLQMQIVASKVAEDRIRHGSVQGFNEVVELDHKTFK